MDFILLEIAVPHRDPQVCGHMRAWLDRVRRLGLLSVGLLGWCRQIGGARYVFHRGLRVCGLICRCRPVADARCVIHRDTGVYVHMRAWLDRTRQLLLLDIGPVMTRTLS